MKLIIPSIIAKSQSELDRRIKKVKSQKIIQLDVMDGKFVKNKSFQFDFKLPKAKYEAQLMVKDPESWINQHGKKVNIIIFHIESTKQPKKIINQIKKLKKKVGIALNPRTPLKKIKPYLKYADMILFMTVYPGSYGAKFQEFTLKRIKELRKISKIQIEVDGGISPKTIKQAAEAGANRFVVGSYLQKTKKVSKAVKTLQGKW
ncbi:MAG: ribulose-phosphate 3-epimerase [Candidatus Woesearchaeota archaeon]